MGVKASMKRFCAHITPDCTNVATRPPMAEQRARLLQVLARLNASIQERSRYQGWSKSYDFTEADAAYGVTVINSWLDDYSGTVDVTRLPWLSLQETLEKCVFGSKIDDQQDLVLLRALIRGMFSVANYKGEREEEARGDVCGDMPTLPAGPFSDDTFKLAPGSPRLESALVGWTRRLGRAEVAGSRCDEVTEECDDNLNTKQTKTDNDIYSSHGELCFSSQSSTSLILIVLRALHGIIIQGFSVM